MQRIIILMIAVLIALVTAMPAAARVHLFNPSDECSGGKAPLGINNPAGNDPKGTPQAGDSPATTKCLRNR